MKLNYALRSDVGKVRLNNEDNFFCNGLYREDVTQNTSSFIGATDDHRFLAAVCDGMGGADLGEIASLLTVQNLTPCSIEDVAKTAASDLQKSNTAICEAISKNHGRPMGSTATLLYIDQGSAITCHLGDSRIYLYRDKTLQQLTTDHTRAQRLVDLGLLSPEEAPQHPGKHELTQHLGIPEEDMILEPQLSEPLPLCPGDVFLLCSDGLTDMVDDAAIAATLATSGSAENMAQSLLDQALTAGGRDNVTVLVIQVPKPLLQRLLRK